jgi:hypothetical protein
MKTQRTAEAYVSLCVFPACRQAGVVQNQSFINLFTLFPA